MTQQKYSVKLATSRQLNKRAITINFIRIAQLAFEIALWWSESSIVCAASSYFCANEQNGEEQRALMTWEWKKWSTEATTQWRSEEKGRIEWTKNKIDFESRFICSLWKENKRRRRCAHASHESIAAEAIVLISFEWAVQMPLLMTIITAMGRVHNLRSTNNGQ